MAHRRKDIHSHHSINNNNLTNIKSVLDDIKTNTNSLNLNTDTLEAKLTDGTQISQIKGNTQGDGSGDSHFLHVDSNGNAKTTVVNAVQVMPHSETNSGTNNDPRDSVAVGLRGRTTITDATSETFLKCDSAGALEVRAMGVNDSATNQQIKTDNSGNVSAFLVSDAVIKPSNITNGDHASFNASSVATMLRARTNITDNTSGKFLLCDANGHLQCDISNQPNFKLEDLSSSLNAQHASGTSRSIAVGLKAKSNISDPTTSTFLKCSTLGELVNNNSTKNQDITHASVAVSVGAGGVDGEVTLNDTDNYVRYMVDGGASSFLALYVEGSQDNSNFVVLGQVQPVNVSSTYSGSLLIENPPKYLRLKNHDLSGVGIKIQIIYGRK